MTEALYSWMQNLACYFILLSVVMNFLPDNGYKKYIQYYMGLLLILILLSPVFNLAGIQEEIDGYVEEFQDQEGEREEWEQRAETWEKERQERLEKRSREEAEVIEGREVVP